MVLDIQPVVGVVGALALLLNFGLTLYGLFSSGAKANARRLDGHSESIRTLDQRTTSLEQSMRAMPAQADVHGLQLALSEVRGDVREMRAIMGRMENILGRHEEHLLDGGKR
ncbi:MAG: DUF2730 family protein [Roseinatronobacter sp.]